MFWAHTLRLTVSATEAAETLAAQHEYQQELRDRGALFAAWILDEGDGFLEILETADRREAEAITEASPLIVAGMAAWSMVRCSPRKFPTANKIEVAKSPDPPDS